MNASLDYAVYNRIDGASRMILFADQGFIKQEDYRYALENTDSTWNDPRIVHKQQRSSREFDGCIDWKYDLGDPASANNVEHIGEYHNGRGNAVFADGHVESIAYDDTRYVCSGAWEARQRIGDEISD
jgi:prepilin-type processing-associated H-X9-DG protein